MATSPSDTESLDTLVSRDPSIISAEKLKKKSTTQKTKKSSKKRDTNLAESNQKDMNAITRFLESAAAAAAEEGPSVSDEASDKVEEVFITFPRRVLLHQYEPEELIALKESKLVVQIQEQLELPGEDFWRMKSKFSAGASSGSNTRWNSGYHGNTTGSSTGEMGSFAISGKGHDRSKRSSNRDRKRGKGTEGHHSGTTRKFNSRDDEEEETPEWMLENDEPVGNSALDFEKWKLKMRLEEKKMNGEVITENDLKLLESSPQIPAPPGLTQTESKNSIDSFFSFYKDDSKKVVNELTPSHGSPSSLNRQESKAVEGNGGSRFSSFFGGANTAPTASPSNTSTPVSSQGSKLLSLINGGEINSKANNSPSSVHDALLLRDSPKAPPQNLSQFNISNGQGSPNQNAANSLLNSIGAATSNNNVKKNSQRERDASIGAPPNLQQQQQPLPPAPQQHQQHQLHHQHQPQPQLPYQHLVPQPGLPPISKKNDVFFLSLLNKAVPSPGGGVPRPQMSQQSQRPLHPLDIPPQFINGPSPQFYGQGPPPPWLMQNGPPPPQFINDQQRFSQQFPGPQKLPFPPMMNGPPPGFPPLYQQQQQQQQRSNPEQQFNPQMIPPPFFQQLQQPPQHQQQQQPNQQVPKNQ